MWADECVMYQIYTLGFCGAPHDNDGVLQPRIRKVIDWADDLEKLGIGAVLFNPVFESDSHGYDTRDFRKLDVRLGSNEDFAEVCKALHDRGIRVILDGVFNHVGRGFWAFQDVLKNREGSPYKDWFQIDFGGNDNYNDGLWYEGWEGHFELVKLNLGNPAVREHIFACVKQWTEEFGIDGLRLDVAYCLDRNFIHELRGFTNSLKEDFFLLGEMLFGDYAQIVNNEMLHSVTNYECYKGIYSSLNEGNMFEISYSLNRQFGSDDWCIYRGLHLLSFVDNHDVSRIASILNRSELIRPAYGLLFGMPGIPCLYYGSEWGIEGDKNQGDDALRPCPEKPVENELSAWIQKLIRIHAEKSALQYGGYRNMLVTNHQLIFSRKNEDREILVAINLDEQSYMAGGDFLQGKFTELISGKKITAEGNLEMPAFGVLFLERNSDDNVN